MAELRCEVVVQLVGMTLLNHRHRAVTIAILRVLLTHLVILNQTIEVDVAIPILGVLHKLHLVSLEVSIGEWECEVVVLSKGVEHHTALQAVAIVRWHLTVVVRTRVLTLIPGKSRVAVETKTQ